jgi:hypothetical protein
VTIVIIALIGLEEVPRAICRCDKRDECHRFAGDHSGIGNRIAILLVQERLVSGEIIEIGIAAIEPRKVNFGG